MILAIMCRAYHYIDAESSERSAFEAGYFQESVYVSFPDIARTTGGIAPGTLNKMDGVAIRDPAGWYAIMINSNRTEAEQIRALKHELSHIRLSHLTDDRTDTTKIYLDNLDDVEREADDYANQMTDEEFSELMTYQIGEAKYA